jgi:hypothetical protein
MIIALENKLQAVLFCRVRNHRARPIFPNRKRVIRATTTKHLLTILAGRINKTKKKVFKSIRNERRYEFLKLQIQKTKIDLVLGKPDSSSDCGKWKHNQVSIN